MNVSSHFDSWGAARPTHGSLFGAWGEALAFLGVVAALFSIGLTRGRPMQRIAQRWHVVLMIGIALLAYSTFALAEQSPPQYGPDWSIIASAAVAVVTLLVGAYAKGLESRLGRTEIELSKLRTMVMRDYPSKPDSERALRDSIAVVDAKLATLTNSMAALHGELQRLRAPHA